MADHTPTDETILPGRNPVEVVAAVFDLEPAARWPMTDTPQADIDAMLGLPADGAPLPPSSISAQEIAEMRNAYRRTTPGRWNWWTSNSMYRLSTTHNGKDGGVLYAFIAKDGVPDISMSEPDRAFVEMAHERFPALLDAIEALTAENARLRKQVEYEQRCGAEYVASLADVRVENARLTSERDELAGKLGKYAMPPWEADACRREAMAARRALCLGEHNPNVAPADIYDRIVALRTANETRSEDVR